MKKPIAVFVGVAFVVVVGLCGFRIEQVNAAYPERYTHSYSLGEKATYAGQDSSGGKVESGSIAVKAEAVALFDYEGMKKLVPEYVDPSIEDGTSDDMKALLVGVEITNISSEIQRVHARDFTAQSGAWANGLYAPLYMALNDDASTIIALEPGEEIRRTFVYLMYDMQFCSNDWKRVGEREFDLVLALYPDKYLVNLGIPLAYEEKGSMVWSQ